MTRLSQKQVAQTFYQKCRYFGVPTESKWLKSGRPKTPHFHVGGAYGMMRIEFIGKTGGYWDVSGYRTAREMQTWLENFNPKQAYLYWKKRDAAQFKAMQGRPRGGKCR